MKNNTIIPSVNFHLWQPCNMRCKFCFATFQDVKKAYLPKGHIPKKEALQLVQELAKFGFQKITFAGGEPTLCPWLSELIKEAKLAGMTTMIVTNGSNINESFLEENKLYLDWIALSIDSLNEETNLSTGRAISGKKSLSKTNYMNTISLIKKMDFGLKINTVVNKVNFRENFVDFIKWADPERWKLFQVLKIEGENDLCINDFMITDKEFEHFISTHSEIKVKIPEYSADMKGSYVMVDPAGRFFVNKNGVHKYSEQILKIGPLYAYNQMDYSSLKFIKRKGIYNWER